MDRFVIHQTSKSETKSTVSSDCELHQPSTSELSQPSTSTLSQFSTSDLTQESSSDLSKSSRLLESEKSDNESKGESDSEPAKKRVIYEVKYRKNWELSSKWVTQKSGRVYCASCNKSLAGGMKHLKRHENSDVHKKDEKMSQGAINIDTALINTPSRITQDEIKVAELKLCMHTVEHNLPFLIFEHLPKLISSLPDKKNISKLVQCSRTKATSLITDDKVGPSAQISIANILKETIFSVIIDETKDISTKKCLVIVVRYLCDKKMEVVDSFFGLLELDEANADTIFDAVIGSFTKHDIPLKNTIGYAPDNASVMIGHIHGVKAKFQEIIPNSFVMGCLSHSLHLCASKACTILPNQVEDFTRNVYNYFAHSAKGQHDFKEYQQFVQAEPHKLLRPSQTRWLSLESAVNRILQQWDALTLYFQNESLLENVNGAKEILGGLNSRVIKLYLHILSYILKIICKMNLTFQSESPKIHTLLPTISANYKMILKFYMKGEIVDNHKVVNINPRNPDYFQKVEYMYFGAGFELTFEKSKNLLEKVEIEQIRLNCLNFYVKSCTDIRTRVDFSNKILNEISSVLDINNIFKVNNPSISLLAAKFPNIIDLEYCLEYINMEWRLLNEYKNEEIKNFIDLVPYLDKLKNYSGEHIFKNLLLLFKAIISLPHGSAAAERIFSSLNIIKNKHRNQLNTETVESLLFSKEYLGDNTCFSWKPDKHLIDFKKS